mmetsp:Transcript_50699/g.124554  ORF Transcript_50699/g.124554 Transcript_50699/m.124554 type:complete len:331 (+) Transcript_50699:123-1115(+)
MCEFVEGVWSPCYSNSNGVLNTIVCQRGNDKPALADVGVTSVSSGNFRMEPTNNRLPIGGHGGIVVLDPSKVTCNDLSDSIFETNSSTPRDNVPHCFEASVYGGNVEDILAGIREFESREQDIILDNFSGKETSFINDRAIIEMDAAAISPVLTTLQGTILILVPAVFSLAESILLGKPKGWKDYALHAILLSVEAATLVFLWLEIQDQADSASYVLYRGQLVKLVSVTVTEPLEFSYDGPGGETSWTTTPTGGQVRFIRNTVSQALQTQNVSDRKWAPIPTVVFVLELAFLAFRQVRSAKKSITRSIAARRRVEHNVEELSSEGELPPI